VANPLACIEEELFPRVDGKQKPRGARARGGSRSRTMRSLALFRHLRPFREKFFRVPVFGQHGRMAKHPFVDVQLRWRRRDACEFFCFAGTASPEKLSVSSLPLSSLSCPLPHKPLMFPLSRHRHRASRALFSSPGEFKKVVQFLARV